MMPAQFGNCMQMSQIGLPFTRKRHVLVPQFLNAELGKQDPIRHKLKTALCEQTLENNENATFFENFGTRMIDSSDRHISVESNSSLVFMELVTSSLPSNNPQFSDCAGIV